MRGNCLVETPPVTTKPIRLAYGTNVAPQEDLPGILGALGGLWADVRRRVAPQSVADTSGAGAANAGVSGPAPLGLGLWIAEDAARAACRDAAAMRTLRAALADNGLELTTVNAFPQRAFHAPVVKEAVYRPDWTDPERFAYTAAVARTVAGVVPSGSDITISTLPVGYPKLPMETWLRATGLLFAAALDLARIRDATGTTIRLALEPEPSCALETCDETIEFFAGAVRPYTTALARTAGISADAAEEILATHLGVCLDLCHTAVEHEDPVHTYHRLRGAGVPVFKVQVSAAVEVPDPSDPARRAALARFVEPRWLHQTGCARRTVVRDLPEALADPARAALRPWRVHFHVPLSSGETGGLPTTRPDVERFLAAIALVPDPPVLEIETYTWSVMPGAPPDLAANIAAEIAWVRSRLGG